MNFSVLLSTYRKDKPNELEIALKSIWDEQIVRPAEIVIVRDGPLSPELDHVLTDFAKSAPVKQIPLKYNQGLGNALRIGLEECSCPYVARMDSDDIAVPIRFKKQTEYLETHPETDILGSAIDEFHTDPDNIYTSRHMPEDNMDIHRFCKRRSPFDHMTLFYRKAFILKVGNYESFDKYEDYWLWIRAVNGGAMCANLPDSLVKVRAGDDMLVRRRGFALFVSEIKLIRKMHEIKFIHFPATIFLFFCRAIPRLLPLWVVRIIYAILHK